MSSSPVDVLNCSITRPMPLACHTAACVSRLNPGPNTVKLGPPDNDTMDLFARQYGYFEMRAEVPHGQGLWPAFWLLHSGPLPWTEIDVLEILGQNITTMYMSNHWRVAADEHQSLTERFTGPDFSQGFHTFAVNWTHGNLTWFVDGVQQAETDEHVPAEPMFILANLAVGGQLPGKPDATTPFPADVDIDYIRVYAPGCQPGQFSTPRPGAW